MRFRRRPKGARSGSPVGAPKGAGPSLIVGNAPPDPRRGSPCATDLWPLPPQYSEASMIVSTRHVTFGSAGSGDPNCRFLS